MKKWISVGWNVYRLQNGNCYSGRVVKQAQSDMWRGEVYNGLVYNPKTLYCKSKKEAMGFVERMLGIRHPLNITVEILDDCTI